MKIAVIGSKQENLGYGRMTLEIRSALERQGCEVVDENTPEVEHVLYITHPSRPEGWYKGQNVNLFSMWETTELAFEHLTSLPLYDRILVPCEANREIFSKVNDNVVTVPLGCDYDLYSPIRRTQSEPFVVLTAGRGALRKGFDVALRVFLKFSERLQQDGYPKPRLIIKGDAELSKNYDNVIVLDEKLSPQDEADLFASAHVYLGLSRGEGWGMIPHQTIAQGCPTILTDAAGHAEFSHYGIPVPWHEVPAINEIVGRSGSWWEPDFAEAFSLLMDVYERYPAYAAHALKGAEGIREFTWDRTAKEILEAVGSESRQVSDEWVECPQLYLSIRVLRPLSCTIGPSSYSFVPGKEYNVSADVKRVLYDSGYLDPECVDPWEKATYDKYIPPVIDQD